MYFSKRTFKKCNVKVKRTNDMIALIMLIILMKVNDGGIFVIMQFYAKPILTSYKGHCPC